MKAIGAPHYLPTADPNCLIDFETDIPTPGPHDLRVKIMAVAINPVDTKIRKSLGSDLLPTPRILGFDASGVIDSMGADVRGFSVGDAVFYSGDVTRAGSNADYQIVDARLVANKPITWSFAEAAAVPLVSLTAWELLFERMSIDPYGGSGRANLLIINGAGGVGSAMIPLARSVGLNVIATASRAETIEWCYSLGANHVLNHREPLRPQAEAIGISEFPYIANLYNTEAYWEITADLLAPLGTLGLIVETDHPLHIGNPFRLKSPRIVWEYMPARSRFQTADMHRQGEILTELALRCDTGDFPKIHTRSFDKMSAANLREAHVAMEAGSAHGKWVFNNSSAS